ncbi:MAG: hypothetical protein QOE35_4034 [Actinomycetota bacterium]
MRKRIAAVLACVCALGAYNSGTTEVAATAADDPLPAVRQVLAARVGAVKGGDRAGFLATVDPKAPAAFKTAQGRLFDGLRTVSLSTFDLQARTDMTGDLSAGLAAKYGNARVFLPETRMVTRIAGYDERDAVDGLWYTYVQRDGKWYIGGDTDLEDVGLLTSRGLWDFGPVQLQRTDHFVILSHPEQAERAKALIGIAEEAAVALAGRWDQPWSGKIPMVLAGSLDELAKVLQSTFDLTKFVAFVVYQPLRDNGWSTTAPRLYVQDKNLSKYAHDFQLSTLTHELDHAAVAPYAGPAIPAWVHEGVADWVATGESTAERKPGGSDGKLPRDYEFTTGSGTAIVRSYAESRSAISYLAARFGTGAPSRLIRTLGDLGPVAGSVDANVDATMRKLFGVSFDQFQAGWARR